MTIAASTDQTTRSDGASGLGMVTLLVANYRSTCSSIGHLHGQAEVLI